MTFKISSKRSDYNFELDSRQLNHSEGPFGSYSNVQPVEESHQSPKQRFEGGSLPSYENPWAGGLEAKLKLLQRDAC